MATWGQTGFQDSLNMVGEDLIYFHDFVMLILIFTLTGVGGAMVAPMMNTFTNKNLLESQGLECIWTVIPGLVLIQIAVPSIWLLYLLDEPESWPSFTVKATGYQWYWGYSYPDFESLGGWATVDSYGVPSGSGDFRLLGVTAPLLLPFFTEIRVLVTSSDVLHSWAVPSLGAKVDACPGRLNHARVFSSYPGVAYGQCSEICGANHSFMPIVIEFLSPVDYLKSVSCIFGLV